MEIVKGSRVELHIVPPGNVPVPAVPGITPPVLHLLLCICVFLFTQFVLPKFACFMGLFKVLILGLSILFFPYYLTY